MKRLLLATLVGLCLSSAAAAKDFVVAHVYDKTGPLEAYAKQTHNGLMPVSYTHLTLPTSDLV